MKPVFLLCLMLAAPNERFQQARQAFLHGVEYAEKGQVDQAILSFRTSLSLRESAAAWFNLGAVCQKAKRWPCVAEATHHFLQQASPSTKGRARAKRYAKQAMAKVGQVQLRFGQIPSRALLDGKPLGSLSHERWIWLNPGAHDLRIEWDGYEPTTRRIDVSRGQKMSVELAPLPLKAPLSVDVQPQHAQIRIDGIPVATGQYSDTMEQGAHHIEAVAEGYLAEEQQIQLGPSGQNVHLVLEPEAEPLVEKWWFWTAVGIAVAGAAVGTTVAVTSGDGFNKGSVNHLGRAVRFSW